MTLAVVLFPKLSGALNHPAISLLCYASFCCNSTQFRVILLATQMKGCKKMAKTKRDEYFDKALENPHRRDPMLLRDPNFTNFIEATVLSFREALQAAYDRGRYDAMHSSEEVKTQTVGKTCLNIKEMAKYLGVSNYTAYQLVHSKGFPIIRIGRRMIIPVKELDIWLASLQPGNYEQ